MQLTDLEVFIVALAVVLVAWARAYESRQFRAEQKYLQLREGGGKGAGR